jgi:hypothetical protein
MPHHATSRPYLFGAISATLHSSANQRRVQMSFMRTRKIGNYYYRYEERRWREGGKVRSESRYIGKAGYEDRGHVPAMIEDQENDKFIAQHEAEKPPDKDDGGNDQASVRCRTRSPSPRPDASSVVTNPEWRVLSSLS